MGALATVWAVSAALSACAPGITPAQKPVSLVLTEANGETLSLPRPRGRPLLLVLFATYDSASQLLWQPLATAKAGFPDLDVVGVALQPDAAVLLPMYGQTLAIDAALAYDPGASVLSGQSDLGRIERVPELILLSSDGHLLARRLGAAPHDELREWLADHLD